MKTDVKKGLIRNLKIVTGVIALAGVLILHFMTNETFGFFGEPVEKSAMWTEGIEWLQSGIIILRFLGAFTFFICLVAVVMNFIDGVRSGTLFPRKNIALLNICSVAVFIYLLSSNNLHIVTDAERVFMINIETMLVPAIIAVSTIMYEAAVRISEENSLTI